MILYEFLGTVAFGSLIIAILRMIRVILEKVEAKLAKYHQDNIVVKGVMCCCKCCFWCLEKFMKVFTTNYTQYFKQKSHI